MSDLAIHVENLSKVYRIARAQGGQPVVRYNTLQEDLLALPRRLWAVTHGQVWRRADHDTVWALKDVCFQVNQGEVVGIIGRNGAGKSTLLKILSRITEPSGGRAEVYGRVGSLLEVGTGFHPELTGRENIFLNGAVLGMRRTEITRKFDEIVAFAEVERFIDTPVKFYSSGMYVRLAFAVAAHLEPEILLVDEVLAVGDAAFQKKCLGKMGEVAKGGRTILFVSHNMGAVASLCKRGLVLEAGQIKVNDSATSAIVAYLQSNVDSASSASLVNHPNRAKGLGQLLTKFVLATDGGVAYYGKPLVFKIGYDFRESVAVPQFCASFHNANGTTAFTLISDYQSNNIPDSLQGTGEVVCRINFLPLLPGSYTIGLKLWQPGQKLDDIENVARFQVEWLERDIGQFNWDSSMGTVYVDAHWQLDDGSND